MLRKHRLKACVCKAQTKRRQIQPDLCRIISRSWEEEYLNKIIVKNESKQDWINWILVAGSCLVYVDLVAVRDWMVLRPADRAVTLNDLGMEPLCLVIRGAISMEENGENSNFLDWFWMESLLLMSYFMWSWDVLVHLFPSLSQLLGLKAWSLDSAVLSSAKSFEKNILVTRQRCKNPQVALVSHGNFEDFWCGFWCRSFLTPIESVSFFAKTVDMCQRFMGDFLVWSPLPYLQKKFEFFQVVLCLVEAPFVHLLDLDLLGTWLFFQVKLGWWMMDDVRCVFWDGFWIVNLFCLVSFMDQVAIRDFVR